MAITDGPTETCPWSAQESGLIKPRNMLGMVLDDIIDAVRQGHVLGRQWPQPCKDLQSQTWAARSKHCCAIKHASNLPLDIKSYRLLQCSAGIASLKGYCPDRRSSQDSATTSCKRQQHGLRGLVTWQPHVQCSHVDCLLSCSEAVQ